MANDKPSFTADLGMIHSNVDIDVESILALSKPQPTPVSSNVDLDNEVEFVISSAPVSESHASSVKRSQRRKPSHYFDDNPDRLILENVTTRLTRSTNELLTDSALRKRLDKQKPNTRQDIIEAALREWFMRNGYDAK